MCIRDRYLGWRSIFAFLVPFGIVSFVLLNRKIKSEWVDAKGEKFDWLGSILYGVALFSFIYGFSRLPATSGWIFIIVGVVMAVVFLAAEKTFSNPVFDIRLILQNRVFAFSGIAVLINYAATSATGFFISLYPVSYTHLTLPTNREV